MGDTDEATPAHLLIADDHALVREGLRTMLSGEAGVEVIAEAKDGQQALTMCRELRPDLVLMDVRMPVMDGLEATKRIKAEMPHTSVMMVTMHENPDYLFEAVKAGAAGYVLKDTSGARLLGGSEEDTGGRVSTEPGACDEAFGKALEGEQWKWRGERGRIWGGIRRGTQEGSRGDARTSTKERRAPIIPT